MNQVMEQHVRWKEARDRLWNSAPPALLPPPQNNLAPIVVQQREARFIPLFGAAPSRLLMALVCAKYGFSSDDITGHRKHAPLVKARHELMYLLYTHTLLTLPQIGSFMHREHTAVLYGARRHFGSMPSRPDGYVPFPARSEPKRISAGARIPASQPIAKSTSNRTVLQQAIARAYASGASLIDVAEAYGTTTRSIYVIAHRLGLKHPNYQRREAAAQ